MLNREIKASRTLRYAPVALLALGVGCASTPDVEDEAVVVSEEEQMISEEVEDSSEGAYCDREAVADMVRAQSDYFQICYERGLLEDESIEGRVSLVWTIELDGTVTDVSISDSTLESPTAESCLRHAIGRVQFPAPDGGSCLVRYPLFFQLADGDPRLLHQSEEDP